MSLILINYFCFELICVMYTLTLSNNNKVPAHISKITNVKCSYIYSLENTFCIGVKYKMIKSASGFPSK